MVDPFDEWLEADTGSLTFDEWMAERNTAMIGDPAPGAPIRIADRDLSAAMKMAWGSRSTYYATKTILRDGVA